MLVVAALVAVVGVVLGGRALVAASTGEEPAVAGRTAPPSPTATVAGPIFDCAAANLALRVELPRDEFVIGESIPITVVLEHQGRSCLVDGSDAGRQVVVTSGADRIWSSADCPSGERSLLLASDDVDTSVVTWTGGRSTQGCPADLPAPGPGTYTVAVTVPGAGAVSSEPVSFTLVAPPAPSVPPAPPVDPVPVDPNAPSE